MARDSDRGLTQERLKELLSYCKETGLFTRLVTAGGMKAGVVAGTMHSDGYVTVRVDNYIYKAHRLAWFYEYGFFPPNEIDHINRVRDDNRITNLRLATKSENLRNRPVFERSKSGIKGIYFNKRLKKWQAKLFVNKKIIHLGWHKDIDDAKKAYKLGSIKYHGEFGS